MEDFVYTHIAESGGNQSERVSSTFSASPRTLLEAKSVHRYKPAGDDLLLDPVHDACLSPNSRELTKRGCRWSRLRAIRRDNRCVRSSAGRKRNVMYTVAVTIRFGSSPWLTPSCAGRTTNPTDPFDFLARQYKKHNGAGLLEATADGGLVSHHARFSRIAPNAERQRIRIVRNSTRRRHYSTRRRSAPTGSTVHRPSGARCAEQRSHRDLMHIVRFSPLRNGRKRRIALDQDPVDEIIPGLASRDGFSSKTLAPCSSLQDRFGRALRARTHGGFDRDAVTRCKSNIDGRAVLVFAASKRCR
jgi:hypothetical protein